MHHDEHALDHVDDHPLDRQEVERIAYQAIGHQFRLPTLFSVVMLVLGFVFGHYVAARHMRQVTGDLELRLAELTKNVQSLEQSVAHSGKMPAARNTASKPAERFESPEGAAMSAVDGVAEDPFISLRMAQSSPFRFSSMERSNDERSPATFSGISTSDAIAVEKLRKEVADEKLACLAELAPYLERKLTIKAEKVAAVLESLFTAEDRRLRAVADPSAAAELSPGRAAGFRSPADRTARMFPPADGTLPSSEGAMAAVPGAETATTAPDGQFFPRPKRSSSMYFPARPKATASEVGSAASF
jgi:hypothetical protein